MKQCEQCCAEFVPSKYNPKQRFCTPQCRKTWEHTHAYSGEAVCQQCGKTFRPKRRERNKYCGHACYHEAQKEAKCRGIMPVWVKVCPVCGVHVDGPHKYCSDECVKEKERQRALARDMEKYDPPTYTCKECGQSFEPEYGNKRRVFCSDECARTYGNKMNPFKGTVNQRARKMLRNLFGKQWRQHYQPINRGRVFNRDGYRCQLCGCKVKRTKTYHPQQATIDHIVPLSLGGGHSYENVQTCCQECNWKKGASVEGQMRMAWA